MKFIFKNRFVRVVDYKQGDWTDLLHDDESQDVIHHNLSWAHTCSSPLTERDRQRVLKKEL